MKFRTGRSNKGASMIVLTIFIAFFIVLPLCLVGFEMGRYYLLITQLENIAGACALSGTGAIATVPTGTGSVSGTALQNLYNGCANEAIYCLQLNSVIGNNLQNNVAAVYTNTLGPSVAPPNPPVGKAAISLTFIDQPIPGGNQLPWHTNLTQSGAVKMMVTISYTTTPVFSVPGGNMILSLMPTETATASAVGGLPQLDVFLCFDVSGSMDDQTGVCLVNRYWDVTNGCVKYDFLANIGAGNTPDTIYQQTNTVSPNIAGTQVNAVPPQNLSYRDSRTFFNQQMRCSTIGAGSPPEQGQLPGGVVGGVAPSLTYLPSPGLEAPFISPGVPNSAWYEPYGAGFASWTDMVVIPSTGASGAAYVAPAGWQQTAIIETEWSRGNLVNTATYLASQGGAAAAAKNTWNTPLAAAAATGKTYASYWQYAAQNATPSFQAIQAAQNFVTTMNLSTDAHFGLSTFSTNASSASINTYPQVAGTPAQYLISESTYAQGGVPAGGTFPLPFVSMGLGTPTSFNKAFAGLAPPDTTYNPLTSTTQLVPTASTDIYDAFNNGITDISANARPTAKKAIVLFTDGVPTTTIPNNTNALIIGLAASCNAKNISVYTIGLAQNAAIVTQEDALLGPMASSGYKGGQYIKTTNATQLDSAFQSIARSLVLLQGQ